MKTMKKYLLLSAFALSAAVIFNACGNSPKNEKAESSTEVAKAQYTCPMHPEVVSDTPGDCPKCGMPLVAKK